MRNTPIRTATAAIAALMLVAGCQQAAQQPVQVAVAPQATAPVRAPVQPGFTPSSLNGTWKPSGGAGVGEYVAIFRNGRFVSRDPANADREALLAQGTYTTSGTSSVNIDYVGAISGTSVKATCTLPTPRTMSCTPTVGGPFNLVRA